MMELDEAIRHAEEKAEELENQCALWKRLADERGLTLVSDYEPCKKCAAEHRQLAEWLKELKRVRELPWLKELKMLRDQKRPHGEWIPVERRLPKEDHRMYLTTIKTASGILISSRSYFFSKEIGWSDACVLAWMPLPEPYKEEGDVK